MMYCDSMLIDDSSAAVLDSAQNITLQEFVEVVVNLNDLPPREKMRKAWERVRITDADVAHHARFSSSPADPYVRRLVIGPRDPEYPGAAYSEFLEIRVVGLLPMQATHVHNHDGNDGLIKHCQGVPHETSFQLVSGDWVRPVGTRLWFPNSFIAEGKDLIHRVTNQFSDPVVFFILYLPPLDFTLVRKYDDKILLS
jgi:hypothetical protein